MNFKHVTVIILSFILTSCNNLNQENIVARIDSIVIDHVVEKRRGCRISKIIFHATIINDSKETCKLDFTKLSDFCDRSIKKSNLNWNYQDSIQPLAIIDSRQIIEISSKDSISIEMISAFYLKQTNIKSIMTNYQERIQFGEILFRNENSFEFEITPKTSIVLKLDDLEVNKNDELRIKNFSGASK